MTWQEGKSEGCREILRYDKKKETEMPHVGYEQLLGFGNLYISLKTYHKKKLLKRALWYKFLISCENGFLFTC